MIATLKTVLLLFILHAVHVAPLFGVETEEEFQLIGLDGFKLDGKLRYPARIDSTKVRKVIILNHGSGSQSMDQDMTAVTRGGKSNLFFRDVAQTLSSAGFTVVRYHKRPYQLGLKIKKDPSFRESEIVKAFVANRMRAYVDDCIACVQFVNQRFPNAEVYLLGHSVGTYVSLQAANLVETVKGVALIGFYAASTEFLLFEQHIARPLRQFEELDSNHDGYLDRNEQGAKSSLAAAIKAQIDVLDIDGDGKISATEYQAANLSTLLVGNLLPAVDFRTQEARYPRVSDILRDASFKVAFFQGMWDNQTPAYNTKAIEFANRNVWKKTNYRFTYFPKLGHALDSRSGYTDLSFDVISPEAREKLAKELVEFF